MLEDEYPNVEAYYDFSSRSINHTQKYKGLNDDVPSVMQVSAIPHSEVIIVQGQSDSPRNTQENNHVQDMNVPD